MHAVFVILKIMKGSKITNGRKKEDKIKARNRLIINQAKKGIILTLLFICFLPFKTFAFVETDIDNYVSMTVDCSGTVSYPFTINVSNNEMLVLNIAFPTPYANPYTLTYDGVSFINTQAYLIDGITVLGQWYLPHPHMGTHNIVITHSPDGCLASNAIAVSNLDLNPVIPLNFTTSVVGTPIVLFTQTITSTSTGSFLNWIMTAQSGAAITGELNTVPYSQPEVIAMGTASGYNKLGSNPVNTSLSVSSPSQLYRGLLVEYPSLGGGGGGGSTTTQDYTYTNGGITTSDIFNMGSTTVNFAAIDYAACNVSSITIDPFASSSLSWGTFDIPQCILQSFKLLLFGTNGFDTYNIINFVNRSSSTLPFLMFKFMGGSLLYINPLTGALINLPNATSSMVFSIPLFSTSSPVSLNLNASSSILNTIKLPEAIDKTASTIEIAVFFVMWAIIFRYINI
jgi:hypothetical protein